MGSIAIEAGIPSDRIHVIPNFLPDSELGATVASLADSPRFFFAGRLEEVKGVDDLNRGVRQRGSCGMGTLVIAGAGGGLEAKVRQEAKELANVEYLGRLSRDEISTNCVDLDQSFSPRVGTRIIR